MADCPASTDGATQGHCLDKSFDFDEASDTVKEFDFITHIRARIEEANGPYVVSSGI